MNFTLMILDIFILRCYIVDTRKYGRILPLDESKASLRIFSIRKGKTQHHERRSDDG